jgi:ATP-dependent helicase HrpA
MRLFRSRDASRQASLPGVRRLVELAVQKDLAWLQKDLRALVGLAPLLAGFCTVDELQAGAFTNLKSHVLPSAPFPALLEKHFQEAVQLARERLPGLAAKGMDRIETILNLRQEILRRYPPPPQPNAPRTLASLGDLGLSRTTSSMPVWLPTELNGLVPKDFLARTRFERLLEIPRYLKALRVRVERAILNPGKDQERSRRVAPYLEALKHLQTSKNASGNFRLLLEDFHWMVEEFKVSVFAQELGTATSVSPKRLDEQLQKLRESAA